ncbi:MAG: hypothetical protein F6J93_05480 [Oscillatoria sp. SIO1A7]|nr:hypothetical protein [Oscillatoria sp. SIO1A7]
MTLDRHIIQGVPPFPSKTLERQKFEQLMIEGGYDIIGEGPAKENRFQVLWTHQTFPRVEAIYSPDKRTAITAYHVDEDQIKKSLCLLEEECF